MTPYQQWREAQRLSVEAYSRLCARNAQKAAWNPNENDKEINLTNTATSTVTEPSFEPADIKHIDVKPTDDGGFLVRVFYVKGTTKRTFHYVASSRASLTSVLWNIAENQYLRPYPAFATLQELQDKAKGYAPPTGFKPGWVGNREVEDLRAWL